ncbi:hypothetical protein P170DRAFT_436667 [Aspergillus steynii IBT 23096]|uniref:DUF3752 domain-containing protein n=1 Tax=Aspergillus steynii IBT 23096 TaxID=1392250 RepID=A0A2I2G801_9EURO|nr:uncharacterized protein P170DRAFT_436667 [Aspergillus steynii IBT 23096]PLB48995.1 hypothetical protein P170DRAFT_436667 [Aspergillus steynii IBT 23096]
MDQPEKRKLDASASDGPDVDKRPRVIGPSLPPPSASQDRSNSEGSDSDSDSDDDFGPSMPPPEGSVPAAPATATEPSNSGPSASAQDPDTAGTTASRRDDWMLQPPDDSSWATRVDPTKLRNRKFQSGKPGSSRPAKSGGVDASWTETPEQKMRRLQDEVLGVSTAQSGGSGGRKEDEGDSKRSRVMSERVEKFNEARRKEKAAEGAARKEKKKEEDDDPSQRAFDKEKDMSLGSKISASQRREMIDKASDFGSRFTKGRYL